MPDDSMHMQKQMWKAGIAMLTALEEWMQRMANYDLYLAADKATSYGTAVISNITQQRTNYLKFQPSERTSNSAPLYHWESSGLAEYRVGPDPTQVAVLREDDTSNAATGGNYLNLVHICAYFKPYAQGRNSCSHQIAKSKWQKSNRQT